MNTVSTNMTIADYCAGMDRHEIIVNTDYQRSDKVWPDSAKSYLIESATAGYPIPKLFLYQITDVKSRKTIKEIVDGQQRSKAIHDFFHDNLVLSDDLDTEDLRGRRYSQLDPEAQQRFLSFSLSIDLFVSASRQDVVEVFRRMNSYTIPLNPEEHRHASYQGRFKWFINRVSKRFEVTFLEGGIFSQKQLVRMADTKLLTELCDALLNGIRTTNKTILDRLYRDRDKQFAEEQFLDNSITTALDQLAGWSDIRNSSLMRPHIIYALVLAVIHTHVPVTHFLSLFPLGGQADFDKRKVTANLLVLAEALENPESAGDFREFVASCSSKTNVRQQRETRFIWMCRALSSDLAV